MCPAEGFACRKPPVSAVTLDTHMAHAVYRVLHAKLLGVRQWCGYLFSASVGIGSGSRGA